MNSPEAEAREEGAWGPRDHEQPRSLPFVVPKAGITGLELQDSWTEERTIGQRKLDRGKDYASQPYAPGKQGPADLI